MTRSAVRQVARNAARCVIEAVDARTLFAAPAVDQVANYTVPVGDAIQIPVTSASTGGAVTYSVKSGSKSIKAGFRANSTYISMKVAGYSEPMVFQLFGDTAPDTVRRITGLINAKFYDGLTFHRIINNFVIQGGDPKGDGTGGPEGDGFDDEFDPNTVFSGTGQLAMANSGKDTNGSQFFITEGTQRALDFNHTIFGQLVRGESTRQAISNLATDSNGKPSNDVVITSVRVIGDSTDGVLLVKGTSAGAYNVKVTGTNADGSSSSSFTLNVTNTDDTTAATPNVNDPPILNVSALQPVYYGTIGTPLSINLSSIDPDGTANNYFVGQFVTTNDATGAFSGTNQNVITVTPTKAGLIELKVGVIESSSATSRGSTGLNGDTTGLAIADTQVIRIAVGDAAVSSVKVYDTPVTAGATTKNFLVGYFTANSSTVKAANYTASIDWGDGTVSAGTIAKNSKGRFVVYTDKTYAAKAAGTEPITLTVTGSNGAYGRGTGTAAVTQATSLSDDGVLTLNGTSGDDVIAMSRKKKTYYVTVNGVNSSYTSAQVASVVAYGLAGNDLIRLTPAVYSGTYLDGGDGNDTIEGGSGVDVINAGAGDDSISTGLGSNNRVAGGDGNDTVYGGDDRDRVFGGAGNDYLIGGNGRDILSGEDGDDTLVGGGSADIIYGGLGNDVINGLGGADNIDGGDGTDTFKFDVLDTVINCEVRV